MIARLKFPLLAIFTLLACLSVHESGHAIAAYASGGWVSEVSIFSLRPHVRIEGAATVLQAAFRAAAGTGFSLLVYFGFIALTPRGGNAIRLARYVASCFVGAELLGWILSALFQSSESAADDAILFLSISGIRPFEVAAVCAAAGLICAGVWYRNSFQSEGPRAEHSLRKSAAAR